MAEYFVGTQAECDDLVARMDTFLGYPNPDTSTVTYSIPQKHTAKSLYFVRLKSVYSPKRSEKVLLENGPDDIGDDMISAMDVKHIDKQNWKSKDQLEADGAFPVVI